VLYAFAATPVNGALKLLYTGAAGRWPHKGSNGTSRVSDTLVSMQDYALTLLTCSGTRVAVDATQAATDQRSALLVIGDGHRNCAGRRYTLARNFNHARQARHSAGGPATLRC